ncbi:hypothetical protein PT286_05710 [Neisseriaceae bacterium ESL0693]|nr:hypothetical protein [Neisseriaceae bacterium ESL0693]
MSCLTAPWCFAAAYAVDAEDQNWHETKALEKLQAICIWLNC